MWHTRRMAETTVYVPSDAADTHNIDPGSGIVGTVEANGRILIDYEGNRYGTAGMRRYATRVQHAAGRHSERYPTIARQLVNSATMTAIGVYDDVTGEIRLTHPHGAQMLAAWIGHRVTADDLLTDSVRHTNRRIIDSLESGTPEQRLQARLLRRTPMFRNV